MNHEDIVISHYCFEITVTVTVLGTFAIFVDLLFLSSEERDHNSKFKNKQQFLIIQLCKIGAK